MEFSWPDDDWPTPLEVSEFAKNINSFICFTLYLKLALKENTELEKTTKPEDIVYSKRFVCLVTAECILKFYNKQTAFVLGNFREATIISMSPYPHLSMYVKKLKNI